MSRWPCLLAASALFAGQTRTWSQGEFADFEKGIVKNLSLRSDGQLTLAPLSRELFDTSSAYLWALAQDSKGNLYAGGGNGAKLYRIPPDGKGKLLADLDALEIHAIAVDSKDRVYAATSPDGKVYRIAGNGKPEVFYDPKSKYIWALAFDSQGNLLVATGDPGEIHRVAPDGKGSVFFKSDETHVRSMTIDASGNAIMGTEPGGLVMRVSPAGEGFVLYQTPKREVTAVAVARDGAIYAAAVGAKQAALPAPAPAPVAPAPAVATVTVNAPGTAVPAPSVAPARHGSTAGFAGCARGRERRQRSVPHRAQRQSAADLEPRAGRSVRHRVRWRGPRGAGHGEQGQCIPDRIAHALDGAADGAGHSGDGVSGRPGRPSLRGHRQRGQGV